MTDERADAVFNFVGIASLTKQILFCSSAFMTVIHAG